MRWQQAPATPARCSIPLRSTAFRFVSRELGSDGRVTLRYALDEEVTFVEELQLPLATEPTPGLLEGVHGLLALLHWVAGVSYFKAALPPRVAFDGEPPPPAAAELLEALYSEGLGELAYRAGLSGLPRPRFPRTAARSVAEAGTGVRRVLVPVGGGKDSAVALEIVRRSGLETALFSVGDAPPIARTVAVAGNAPPDRSPAP